MTKGLEELNAKLAELRDEALDALLNSARVLDEDARIKAEIAELEQDND